MSKKEISTENLFHLRKINRFQKTKMMFNKRMTAYVMFVLY